MKRLFFILSVAGAMLVISCDEDDLDSENCAGCDSDFPWSVSGSTECYETLEDCDSQERGNCDICL